jgi:eukaryotic-like serine/threonine-protein kinase
MSEQQQEQIPARPPHPQTASPAPLLGAMSRRKLLATTGAGMAVLATAGGVTWWIRSRDTTSASAHTPTATPSLILGTQQWRFQTGSSVTSSPTVVNGVVYVGSDDSNLYALETTSGKLRWRFPTSGLVRSSPAVANGVVYVGSDD